MESLFLGFCLINSKISETVYYNQNIHQWDNITFYLNNNLIVENNSESFNWKEVAILSGKNNSRLILPIKPGAISYNNNYKNDFSVDYLKKEFMTTIKGILTTKIYQLSDASVNLSTPLGLSLMVLSDENGRFEANIIKQAYNDEITIYVNKNNLRYSSTLKLDKRISNKGLNIDLEEYYDSISGKIFTLFEDKTPKRRFS